MVQNIKCLIRSKSICSQEFVPKSHVQIPRWPNYNILSIKLKVFRIHEELLVCWVCICLVWTLQEVTLQKREVKQSLERGRIDPEKEKQKINADVRLQEVLGWPDRKWKAERERETLLR